MKRRSFFGLLLASPLALFINKFKHQDEYDSHWNPTSFDPTRKLNNSEINRLQKAYNRSLSEEIESIKLSSKRPSHFDVIYLFEGKEIKIT